MVNQVIVETSLITFGTFGRGFNLLDLSDNGGRSHKSAKADLQDLPQHANCTFSTLPFTGMTHTLCVFLNRPTKEISHPKM